VASLLGSLASSAADYAHRALEAYVTGHQADFYVYGGFAVELALKARLVRSNPAFIAPREQFLAAVAFTKASRDVSLVPPGTPSVGAVESLRRVIALDPAIKHDLTGTEELFRLRNSVAHLGTIDETMERRTVVSFLRAINALLRKAPETFWSPHEEFVRTVLDETSAESVRAATAKVAAARMHYEQRRKLLSTEEAVALDALLEAEVKRGSGDETFIVECPACGSNVLLSGENSLEWEPEYDNDGVSGASPWILFSAQYLYCGACGLELDGAEELEAVGVDWNWQNEEADLDEWLADHYAE
jgi:hypothetical protein